MKDVARELEGAIEAQRQSFQIELEHVGGELEQLKSKSKLLEQKLKA